MTRDAMLSMATVFSLMSGAVAPPRVKPIDPDRKVSKEKRAKRRAQKTARRRNR